MGKKTVTSVRVEVRMVLPGGRKIPWAVEHIQIALEERKRYQLAHNLPVPAALQVLLVGKKIDYVLPEG